MQENINESALEIDNLKPGDGITIAIYTDCQAYTILRKTKTTITAQRDTATLDKERSSLTVYSGGFAAHVTGEQVYTYSPDPNGSVVKITRRRWFDGEGRERITWKRSGFDTKSPGGRAFAGRNEYYDYNF